jgi:hypothetical protein
VETAEHTPSSQRRIDGYEAACARVEDEAAAASRAARQLDKAIRALGRAARTGEATKLRRAAEAIPKAAAEAAEAARRAAASWPYDDDAVSAYLQDGYEAELVATAREAGLELTPLDDRWAAFPVVVRVVPGRRSVVLDRATVRALRPTAVVAAITARRGRPSTRPQDFIEVLHRAAVRVAGGDADRMRRGVELADVYDTLTLLPEARRAYSKADFARDLFLLDTSGLHQTRSGVDVRLSGSTGTKGGSRVFSVVPPDGPPRNYRYVRVEEPQP